LEVHGLAGADAQQDSQDFQVGDVLCQRRIKASATLLDESEVESRRESDRLEVIGKRGLRVIAEIDDASLGVSVASWDSGVLIDV
jgi:hypothetical protein